MKKYTVVSILLITVMVTFTLPVHGGGLKKATKDAPRLLDESDYCSADALAIAFNEITQECIGQQTGDKYNIEQFNQCLCDGLRDAYDDRCDDAKALKCSTSTPFCSNLGKYLDSDCK